MQRWIASSVLLLALGLSGCGGGGGSSGGGSASSAGGERGSSALGPEGCTGHDASQEAVCVASGCRWGQALLCMGTASADREVLPPRPCACVCAQDELECSMVPSAAPAE